jgi:hypothetical protein
VASIEKALAGVYGVFSVQGALKPDLQLGKNKNDEWMSGWVAEWMNFGLIGLLAYNLIDASKRAGVQHFIQTTVGSTGRHTTFPGYNLCFTFLFLLLFFVIILFSFFLLYFFVVYVVTYLCLLSWGTGRWNEDYWIVKHESEERTKKAGFPFYTILQPGMHLVWCFCCFVFVFVVLFLFFAFVFCLSYGL